MERSQSCYVLAVVFLRQSDGVAVVSDGMAGHGGAGNKESRGGFHSGVPDKMGKAGPRRSTKGLPEGVGAAVTVPNPMALQPCHVAANCADGVPNAHV
jgi:hypothetical protein